MLASVRVCRVRADVWWRSWIRECRRFGLVCRLYLWPRDRCGKLTKQMLECAGIEWRWSTLAVAIVSEGRVVDSWPKRVEIVEQKCISRVKKITVHIRTSCPLSCLPSKVTFHSPNPTPSYPAPSHQPPISHPHHKSPHS